MYRPAERKRPGGSCGAWHNHAFLRRSTSARPWAYRLPMASLSLVSRRPEGDHLRMTDQRRGRILVVDDEPTIAEIVARYLERAHYETRLAGDGHAALAHASTWHPDLVVLDLMLPGLDGLEVMRLLRETGGPRVAVILLTAKGEGADRIDGLRLGGGDYIAKKI